MIKLNQACLFLKDNSQLAAGSLGEVNGKGTIELRYCFFTIFISLDSKTLFSSKFSIVNRGRRKRGTCPVAYSMNIRFRSESSGSEVEW